MQSRFDKQPCRIAKNTGFFNSYSLNKMPSLHKIPISQKENVFQI